MSKTIYITDGDALNIDRVVVSTGDLKGCKVFYSCDLIDKYEVRLQAEKLAMFKELQQEIEKLDTYDIERTHGLIEDGYVTTDVSDIIQDKINALKENKE